MIEVFVGLIVVLVLPVAIFGLIINFVYTQYRDYKRRQSRKRYLQKIEAERKSKNTNRGLKFPKSGERLPN